MQFGESQNEDLLSSLVEVRPGALNANQPSERKDLEVTLKKGLNGGPVADDSLTHLEDVVLKIGCKRSDCVIDGRIADAKRSDINRKLSSKDKVVEILLV